jgi:uncharacterized Zn finger protein
MKITAIRVLGDSGKTYTVSAQDDGTVTCTCPDWQHRGAERDCKHIAYVKSTISAPVPV